VSTSEATRDDETVSEPVLVVRTFQAEISEDGDGRTLEGLVIPYEIESTVSDPPDFRPYKESIARGAFRSVVNAPNRVLLDFEHYGALPDAVGSMGSIAGTLGHAVTLEERSDGLFGRFRVLKGPDGDKALELAHEGVLGGFSAAMRPLRSTRTPAGTMRRLKVHLDRVSLCRQGAYEQARVMAIRSEQTFVDMKDLTKPLDPVLAASLARLGVKVPEHLLEQPTDEETQPTDEGTSEADS
jgi:HK97 family phage prohead protease